MDPRVPDELEAFAFMLNENTLADKVEWMVDGSLVGSTKEKEYLWRLSRGTHTALAKVWPPNSNEPIETKAIKFYVK
jgi:penicillin-binding protein 1C